MKDVVLLGAGHAHIGALRAFGLKPDPRVRLTLITRELYTLYSGMLPSVIAGDYREQDAHVDISHLCRFANARLLQDSVVGLDLASRQVRCADHAPVSFDLLSLNIGATTGGQLTPGVAEHAVPVKPVDGFLAHFELARKRVLAADGRAHIAVVGAGAGGVELVLALQRRLTRDVQSAGYATTDLRFSIFTPAPEILTALPAETGRRLTDVLCARGVTIRICKRVTSLETGYVVVNNGAERIAADEVFWTTGAEAAVWLKDTGMSLDTAGFVRTGRTLQSVSHPYVFAVGDTASLDGYDVPKSGVYAVRSGTTLTANIRRLVRHQPLRLHQPQKTALYLISTADGRAVGTRNGITFSGKWVWQLKNWIDRHFVQQFKSLRLRTRGADARDSNTP